jgi:hypothetical protein
MGILNKARTFPPTAPTCATISVGLASAVALAAPATGKVRKMLTLQNTSPDAVRVIVCNFGATAVLADPVLQFPQNGGLVYEGDSVPQVALYAIADGTNAKLGLIYTDEDVK